MSACCPGCSCRPCCAASCCCSCCCCSCAASAGFISSPGCCDGCMCGDVRCAGGAGGAGSTDTAGLARCMCGTLCMLSRPCRGPPPPPLGSLPSLAFSCVTTLFSVGSCSEALGVGDTDAPPPPARVLAASPGELRSAAVALPLAITGPMSGPLLPAPDVGEASVGLADAAGRAMTAPAAAAVGTVAPGETAISAGGAAPATAGAVGVAAIGVAGDGASETSAYH